MTMKLGCLKILIRVHFLPMTLEVETGGLGYMEAFREHLCPSNQLNSSQKPCQKLVSQGLQAQPIFR